ncbi:tRNA-specific 2-thiouridylase MnmA [Mucinivorans hirudinis]|uniref:tRNA-uridine 2-sulfurtransferase n=1 Tax=Mucinivorans hirudinis TaxID=1433126 RepID=A0A060R742_9BACT|nr:tRNA-specific 2-thiouridylase MnmA [Mucinivorans hirudinis]
MEQVLVALSGGIDSAATALMLRDRGFHITGLYIDMVGTGASAAQRVARGLGIELVVENVEELFREQIINHTLAEHQAGRTPSPCTVCNRLIKWDVVSKVADRLGIEKFATGHYVRIINSLIHKGIDPAKDQSYYLWSVPPAILQRAITPLGDFTKKQVREYLSRHKEFEELAAGSESMSICFLGTKTYGEFLQSNLPCRAGEVVDMQGNVIGEHAGYQLYTIGQKRGFTGAGAVARIDVAANRVVTTREPLLSSRITIDDWVLHQSLGELSDISIKIRGLGRNPQSAPKSVSCVGDKMVVELAAADAFAVAAGQPLVFYRGEALLGGGIIIEA